MRILFVSEYYPPKVMGGGEVNLAITAEALARSGVDVSALTSGRDESAVEEINGVKIYRILKTGEKPNTLWDNFQRFLFFPRSLEKEIKKIVQEIKPDAIHFQGTSVVVASRIANLGIPLFATVESYPALCPKGDRLYQGKKECTVRCSPLKFIHCQGKSSEIGKMKNSWYLKYNPLFLFLVYRQYKKLRTALQYCTLIPISAYVKKILELHDLQSTEAVPNIILQQEKGKEDIKKGENNLEKEKDNPKEVENTNTKRNTSILYLGALISSKGPQILMEALRGLPPDSYHSDFYGEGILKEELQEFILKNNLNAEIHSPVPSEQVSLLYISADVVVVPSLWPEPFGRIPLEALAVGTHVIASDIGGIKETAMKSSVTLFNAGNVPELRLALRQVFLQEKTTNSMKKTREIKIVKTKLFQKYEKNKVISCLLDVYTSSKRTKTH